MIETVGVRFKKAGKIYYFSPNDIEIKLGDFVIVETARGVEMGEVVLPLRMTKEDEIVSPLKPVMRISTKEDMQKAVQNSEKEKQAFDICMEKINKHKLEMKLVDVEYTFDQNKILFYFTSDGRVDFRELVKDLASVFKTRIELRQIGVRDEAKMLGGLGICGRNLCCNAHLGSFEPVSIRMAKEQSLSLNPTKISGACGRLMCCLKYEQDAYEELLKITPSVGAIVQTPAGSGTVTYVNLIKGILKVHVDTDGDNVFQNFHVSDIKILKNVEVKINDDELKALKNLEG